MIRPLPKAGTGKGSEVILCVLKNKIKKDWRFHPQCVGITAEIEEMIPRYTCLECVQ